MLAARGSTFRIATSKRIRLDGGLSMPWVQALITALLSGLFSGAIIFALNERRERSKLYLDKAEAAIEAYADWVDELSHWPMVSIEMFIEDREVGRTKSYELWRSCRRKYRKAQALIGIYLPDQMQHVLSVSIVAQQFIASNKEAVNESVAGRAMPPGMSDAISVAMKDFVDAGAAGLNDMLAEARRTAKGPFLVRAPRLPIWKRRAT